MDELRQEFEALKSKFSEQEGRMAEQSALLEQARSDQREALTLARRVLERSAETERAPATVYVQRDRKYTDFSGGQEKGDVCRRVDRFHESRF